MLKKFGVTLNFELKTMGDYDLYFKKNVLLLADVFEKFRNMRLEYYGLDLCHYFSSTRLSWDAMLKMTDVKLDLISNTDMNQFIEKGMRGRVSNIAQKRSKTNNEYLEPYIKINHISISYTKIQVIYIDRQCQNIFL